MAYTLSDLERAAHHIVEGEHHLARQRLIVAKLAEQAASPRMQEQARQLLAEFEQALRTHRAHRDEIAAELHRDAVAGGGWF